MGAKRPLNKVKNYDIGLHEVGGKKAFNQSEQSVADKQTPQKKLQIPLSKKPQKVPIKKTQKLIRAEKSCVTTITCFCQLG